ncbi:TolC family protein [Phycisphaerales bacterium AB-hyl4]|uniref:TolC family protein n=1 Tax=Natronomicrosphaera hydrolytica TaxID=3242702 RepID=A0ABV4U6Y5_9BACT
MLPHSHPRRALFALPALLLPLATGCVGPLDSERYAFDRWQQVDDRTHHTDRATPDEQPGDRDADPRHALPANPTLDDYLAYAEAHHPAPAAAFHEWRAALERVPQARALMDPTVSYRVWVQRTGDRQAVGLSQAFPWYGTLRARGDVAMAQALAAEQRFEQQRRAVADGVRQAYSDYLLFGLSLRVLEENIRILEHAMESAEALFEAGDTPYTDVIRAGVALEQTRDERDTLEAQRTPLIAQLNAAIGRSARHDLPMPTTLPPSSLEADEPALLARLTENNPELQALAFETTSQRHNIRLARQNRIPELALGVDYTDAIEARDTVSVVASINVPIWFQRTRAERREALAAFGSATHQRTQRLNELEAELRLAYARYRDADRRVAVYEQTLVPMAREALESAEASYAAGESVFESVTQAQLALQESQLTYANISVDRFQRLAEIERIVGRLTTNNAPSTREPQDDHPNRSR